MQGGAGYRCWAHGISTARSSCLWACLTGGIRLKSASTASWPAERSVRRSSYLSNLTAGLPMRKWLRSGIPGPDRQRSTIWQSVPWCSSFARDLACILSALLPAVVVPTGVFRRDHAGEKPHAPPMPHRARGDFGQQWRRHDAVDGIWLERSRRPDGRCHAQNVIDKVLNHICRMSRGARTFARAEWGQPQPARFSARRRPSQVKAGKPLNASRAP